ncbi:MAG: acetoacetate decarboxylase family protein [Methylocella sp.]
MNGGRRFCELVRYPRQDVRLKGARNGPEALQLFAHAMGYVAKLPVLDVFSGTNFVADVTLGVGDVVHDYLA